MKRAALLNLHIPSGPSDSSKLLKKSIKTPSSCTDYEFRTLTDINQPWEANLKRLGRRNTRRNCKNVETRGSLKFESASGVHLNQQDQSEGGTTSHPIKGLNAYVSKPIRTQGFQQHFKTDTFIKCMIIEITL